MGDVCACGVCGSVRAVVMGDACACDVVLDSDSCDMEPLGGAGMRECDADVDVESCGCVVARSLIDVMVCAGLSITVDKGEIGALFFTVVYAAEDAFESVETDPAVVDVMVVAVVGRASRLPTSTSTSTSSAASHATRSAISCMRRLLLSTHAAVNDNMAMHSNVTTTPMMTGAVDVRVMRGVSVRGSTGAGVRMEVGVGHVPVVAMERRTMEEKSERDQIPMRCAYVCEI